MSPSNDDPMGGYKAQSPAAYAATLVSKNENTIVFSNGYHSKAQPLYLGVIVDTANGQIIWENRTRPLP